MSVKLRLRRMGKKKQPFYRIVAIDSRAARDARYVESLGSYDPLKNPAELTLDEERALYWLGQGAIPSDTVRSFLKRRGLLLKWHLIKQGAEEEKIAEELKKWEVLQLERQKRLDALVEQQKREGVKKKEEVEEAKTAGPDDTEKIAVKEPEQKEPAEQEEAAEKKEAAQAAEPAAQAQESESPKEDEAKSESSEATSENTDDQKEEPNRDARSS